MKKIINNSGFVSINTGDIKESYAGVKVKGKKSVIDAFCCNNTGKIESVKSLTSIKKDSRLVRNNKGEIPNSVFKNVKTDELFDGEHNLLDQTETEYNLTPNIIHKVPNPDADSFTKISSSEDLIAFRDGVNNSDPTYVKGNFILTDNIDLGSKAWLPIGNDISPFEGKFDGNGFYISGFIVKDKSLQYGGFFGNIKNAFIINLSVDGLIRSGKYSGVFVGNNENSIIQSCVSNGKVSSGGYSAGFIGKNSGTIENVNCFGIVTKPLAAYLLPLLLLLALLLLILALLLAWYLTRPKPEPVVLPPRDPDVVAIDESVDSGEDNVTAYMLTPQIEASTATSEVFIDYKNPSGTDKAVRLTLQTDPSNSNSSISETTGLIYPGEGLEYLQLAPYPNGTELSPGTYEVYLMMDYYDLESGELMPVYNSAAMTLTITG